MKTDLACSRLCGDMVDLTNYSAFEVPITGSRTHPNPIVQWSYCSGPTKLELVGRLFNEAVRTDGLHQKAVRNAWKVVSDACHGGFTAEPVQPGEDFIIINTSAVPDCLQLYGTMRVSSPFLQVAGRSHSYGDIDDGRPPDESDGAANTLDQQVAEASGWVAATNTVLQNSRAMTAAEHRLAVQALWTEVE